MHLIDGKPFLHNLVLTSTMAICPLAACSEAVENVPAQAATATPEAVASTCAERGVLQGMVSGAINATLDWPDSALRCESMPRPNDAGVRLRLSGEVRGERLAFIIALPELHAGETGSEFDSNVTISVEGSGRFFSTPNLDTCWTNIAANEPLSDSADAHILVGSLSCVGPLGEINGDGFVDIRNLKFSGLANWNAE